MKSTKNKASEATKQSEVTVVHEWGSVHTARVRVCLRMYNGVRMLDIRRWVDAALDGNFVATRKGIALRTDDLPELEEGIRKVKEALKNEAGS